MELDAGVLITLGAIKTIGIVSQNDVTSDDHALASRTDDGR